MSENNSTGFSFFAQVKGNTHFSLFMTSFQLRKRIFTLNIFKNFSVILVIGCIWQRKGQLTYDIIIFMYTTQELDIYITYGWIPPISLEPT